MADRQEKIFADGFSFKRRENAQDFHVGRVSVKVDEAIAFLKQHAKNGWVNLNVNQAKSENYYMELDQWEPSKKKEEPQPVSESSEDDLPF